MALFIRREDASGDYFPARVGIHLIAISNADLGYGEQDNAAEPRGIEVTYNRNDPGVCAQRLDDLVNTNYGVDIIIWGVDDGYALSDGTAMTSVGGVAIPVGSSLNPGTDILTIYDTSDCGGQGWYAYDTDGDKIYTASAVILYHELSHCHDFATGVATTEPDATADENDMRTQLGHELRDVNNHGGGCGLAGANCCIVASISTGSSFSHEVNSIRRVRDFTLRNTEIGREFFDRLHYDYYGFSPEVCRLMARDTRLTSFVREVFVRPLTCILQTLVDYADSPDDPRRLGRSFERHLNDVCNTGSPELELLVQHLRKVDRITGDVAQIDALLRRAGFSELAHILQKQAVSSPFIRWAIVDMVVIFMEVYGMREAGATTEALGHHLIERFSSWAPRLPITEVWWKMATYTLHLELQQLRTTILSSETARYAFGQRLLRQCPTEKLNKYRKALIEEGYVPDSAGGIS